MEFKETLDMFNFLKVGNLSRDAINTLDSMMYKVAPNNNKDIIDVEVVDIVDDVEEVKELEWKN